MATLIYPWLPHCVVFFFQGGVIEIVITFHVF
jgi:hypothetical protein